MFDQIVAPGVLTRNPNGIPSFSPGLGRRGNGGADLPREGAPHFHSNLEKVASLALAPKACETPPAPSTEPKWHSGVMEETKACE